MTFNKAVFGLIASAAARLAFAATVSTSGTVVYPDHYAKDPGAGFSLVILTDVAQPTPEILDFADRYRGAVFVCGGAAGRDETLKGLFAGRRVFSFPRGRIEIPSSDLGAPDVVQKLRNYFKWGRYQAETPKLTRYGARIYRKVRTATPPPKIAVPEPWRVVEGDDGDTGCDARLAYFTVEADGTGLPPPRVTVFWPGVAISSVDGCKDVRITSDGVELTPTDRSGGANYLTMVYEDSLVLALHHHVEGAQHGPYGGRPLPWEKIRASDNWRAACRAMFKAAGLGTLEATDGAHVNLYGFDSNFPRRHVDCPEHFHVMLEWDDWQKNDVGHYTLDDRGFIRGNNFLVCGEIAGGLSSGYHPQKAGETTDYVGPKGGPVFSLEMLGDGRGLVLHKPGCDAAWRIRSDNPVESVSLSVRESGASVWKDMGAVSVSDDTEGGRYVITCRKDGAENVETIFYARDTARLVSAPESVRKVLNFVNFVRGCEPRSDANANLDEPLREEIARNTKYGFRNTILMQYDALLRDDLVALAKTAQQDRTEYGVWVEMCRQLVETCGIEWKSRNGWDWDWFVKPGFLMAYTPEQREKICDELFRLFKARFGAYPKTMGSWMLDAHSMDYVQRKYGVKAFMICREQDATDAYTLNGGYFNGAYYPSKKNALSAAVDMKNAIRAPVFRMLTPDPIYNYGTYANAGFNTYTAAGCPTLEPTGNPDVAWYFGLYGEPVAPLNLSYMQTGQENSFYWSRIQKSLDEQLAMAAKYAAEGKISIETVSETAERFAHDHPENCPQTQIALVDRTGANRKSVWYNAKHYRANLFFEDGQVRFRDIHVMDDKDEEDWLRAACPDWHAEYHTPFVVDEKRLPTSALRLDGTYADFRVSGDGVRTLVVEAVRTDGSYAEIVFGEDRLSIRGATLSCHNAKARQLLSAFEIAPGEYDFKRPRPKDALFEAPWIGDGEPDREGASFYGEDPAPEFTASFVLPEGQSSAEITVACAGYYALRLNGRPVGVSKTSLMPLWSPFGRTVYADSFVATGLKPAPAENVVSVTLGNGFYNLPPLKFWGAKCFRESLAHGRPCFKLAVAGVEGPISWTCRKSNVMRNCVYLGTEVDATHTAGEPRPAAHVFGPTGAVVPRTAPPVDFLGDVAGKVVERLADGTYVVDFGANLTGVPCFEFSGQARGDRIEIVYGERLHADGSVNVLTQTAGQVKNAGMGGEGAPVPACQRDAYVCAGGAAERFEPPFTWHVCRYAEVRGAKAEPKAVLRPVSSVLRAVAPGKDFQGAGSEELMKLHEMCVRTFRDNLVGVQSDCPGRERLGYGGDIVATCEALCLNFDMKEFYLKTLQDFADEAEGDGWITETAPFVGIADANGLEAGGADRRGPVSWALAVPVLMDTLLRHYPDAKNRVLAFYPTCARYVRLMDAAYPSGIVPTCIGDHEAVERAPNDVTATAHWYEFVRLTAKFAELLGQNEDAAAFGAIDAKVKAAFQGKFVKDGFVANGTQSAQAIALYLGLVPPEQVKSAERRLVEAIEEKDYAPYTGIFSTRYMLDYLSTHGYDGVAKKLVTHKGFPGWLHMINSGATTLWESWKESDDVYSNCHPMFGSVDEWILKHGARMERELKDGRAAFKVARCAPPSPAAATAGIMKPLNIVNFARGSWPYAPERDLTEAMRGQIAQNRKYGLASTILLEYSALQNGPVVATAKTSDPEKTAFGIWFEVDRPLADAVGIRWQGNPDWDWDWHTDSAMSFSYPIETRARLVDENIRRFREVMGEDPKVFGAWMIDAWTMGYIAARYPCIEAFVICREQDSIDAYDLRGGYFGGVYYPSARNALSAARDMKNAIGVPCFRLSSCCPIRTWGDMAQKYMDGGCPTNEAMWLLGYDPDGFDWITRTYLAPTGALNLSPYLIGQENTWDWNRIGKPWERQMAMLARWRDEGRCADETLVETARAFKRKFAENVPQTQVVLDDWAGEGSQSAWYNSRFYRCNVYKEGTKVMIRDLHVMHDGFQEEFFRKACRETRALQTTLPVYDAHLMGGVLAKGCPVLDGDFDSLSVATPDDRTLVVTATRKDGTKAVVTLEEDRVTVRGARLSYAEKLGTRPFLWTVTENGIDFEYQDFKYCVRVGGDIVADENVGYTVMPKDGAIVYTF